MNRRGARIAMMIVSLLAWSGGALSRAGAETSALEKGRSLTERFYAGELAGIYDTFSAEMKAAMTLENLGNFRQQVSSQVGKERAIIEETVTEQGQATLYMRLAEFDKAPTPLIIQWALAKDGSIAGFFIRPAPAAAPTEFLEYQTQTTLRLPFEGNWFVFWGGRSALVNHHVASPSQRFACDFIIMKDGKSFEGNGIVNEEFIAWGKPVLAPGDGIITTVVNDVEDNAPRKMNPAAPAGNHVIIDHGNGEYSLLAHFQKGSITVKTGDSVKAGTVLGRCGNSGNTSEPHLHYHLQNSPNFPEGRGLPAQFQHYSADGKDVERGEPHRGQTIHSR